MILSVALLAAVGASQEAFNPKDLDGLEFFVESVTGLAVAKNISPEAYENTRENTRLEKVWSDAGRFPHGTVRWWRDQSPYARSAETKQRTYCPFDTGRDLGQDDHDRPGYIPDGANGKPCVRGGLISKEKGEHHGKQPCYFEFQLGSRDLKFGGAFSVFLLARPVDQERRFCYFGVYHRSVLIQEPRDGSLHWKNGGTVHRLTGPGAVRTGNWQLLELHRDAAGRLACLVNGKDATVGTPEDVAPFEFMMLFNNNKGQSEKLEPFAGDIASLIIYRVSLDEDERRKVRGYLDGLYRFMPGD